MTYKNCVDQLFKLQCLLLWLLLLYYYLIAVVDLRGVQKQELWSLLEFMVLNLFETGEVDLKKLLNAEDTDFITRMKSILGLFILRGLKAIQLWSLLEFMVPDLFETGMVDMKKILNAKDTFHCLCEVYFGSIHFETFKI